MYALALDAVRPADDQLKQQVDWLMSHRSGHRWSPEKATGLAMQALCNWYGRTKFTGERYRLTIFVNDLKAQEVEIDADPFEELIQCVTIPPPVHVAFAQSQ